MAGELRAEKLVCFARWTLMVVVVVVLQGCGFGYRYTRLPHLLKTKPEDANLPSLQSRCCQQGALPQLSSLP